MLKSFFVGVLILVASSSLYGQHLSTYRTSLFGNKYFVDEKKVSRRIFEDELKKDAESYKMYRDSKKQAKYSSLFNVGQWIMLALQLREVFDNDPNPGYEYLGANILLGVGTVYFKDKSRKTLMQSTVKFNSTSGKLGFNVSPLPTNFCSITFTFE